MTTPVGAWLDPLSDKLFVIVPALALAAHGDFPWWAAVVIVLREVAVSLLRWRLDQRGVSMPASRAGKAKTLASSGGRAVDRPAAVGSTRSCSASS